MTPTKFLKQLEFIKLESRVLSASVESYSTEEIRECFKIIESIAHTLCIEFEYQKKIASKKKGKKK